MGNEEQQKDQSRQAGFHKGVVLGGAGSLLNIAFLFLETAIAVRMLPEGSYGGYVILVTMVNFLVIASDFGFKISVAQLIASSDRSSRSPLVGNALAFRCGVVGVVSIVVWLAQILLLRIDGSSELWQYLGYVPLMFAAMSFDELLFGMLQGFHSYTQMAVSQIIRSVLRLGLTVFLLGFLGLGMVSLIASWIISFALSAGYQYLVLPGAKLPGYQGRLLRRLLRSGLPLQLSSLLWFAFSYAQVFLLGTLAGPTSVAYYSVAARIPQACHRLSESYIAVYFPAIAGLLGQGNKPQATTVLNRSLRLLSFAAALAAIVAVVFSQDIVTVLFSERYVASSLAFALLMIAFHMTLIVSLMGYTLTAAGYAGRSLQENAFRTALTLLANLLLIPLFGFVGSAYASVVAAYGANPVAVGLLRKSELAVATVPYVKQAALLLGCAGLFWLAQPPQIVYKLAIIALFVMLNLLLSTISFYDWRLVVPKGVIRRAGVAEETPSQGH